MTTLKRAFVGQQTIFHVVDNKGKTVASVYPTKEGIHIASMHFASEDPIVPSQGEIGFPGYLVKFRE